MAARRKDPDREDRIENEIVVDAYGSEEQSIAWYCHLEDKIHFPFQAKCISLKPASPLIKGETVEVRGLASEKICTNDMLVLIRWQGRKMAVPLSQLDADEATSEAIGDWHYRVRLRVASTPIFEP